MPPVHPTEQRLRRTLGDVMGGSAAPSRSTVLLAAAMLITACDQAPTHDLALLIPQAEDWTDCGPIFYAGAPSAWDHILWGGFAATAIKRDGRFWLYYQGSDGYHEIDETVTHRAIGLATSRDGITFDKHPGSPVITFSPGGQHEEGAVSSAVVLDDAGSLALYYGANTWVGGDLVEADARRAVSTDGITFTDTGVVLDHEDYRSVWGAGDEVFPVVAFEHDGRHLVYYIPNGVLQRGRLGVALRDDSGSWTGSRVNSGGRSVPAWGPGSAVRVADDVYALFLTSSRGETPHLEVRTVSATAPDQLSAPVRRYAWADIFPRAVLFDPEADEWYLYYRSGPPDRYGVMVAGRQC